MDELIFYAFWMEFIVTNYRWRKCEASLSKDVKSRVHSYFRLYNNIMIKIFFQAHFK